MPKTTILATWKGPGEVAIRSAAQALAQGSDLLTCLETGLATAELDPGLIAIGIGSVPNADGDVELDAAIMEGRTLQAGAVCAVQNVVPAISLARRVMEKTNHVMLAGEGARQFAIQEGFALRSLHTEDTVRRYDAWFKNPRKVTRYVHVTSDPIDEHVGDTVTMLGLSEGHTAAASSTSGIPFKLAGRVGDSPIIGGGIYADDEVGTAGSTGSGEELWKACASMRTVEAMRRGLSPQEACTETIEFMRRRNLKVTELPCVVLALRKDGEFFAVPSIEPFPLWICRDGEIELKVYEPLL